MMQKGVQGDDQKWSLRSITMRVRVKVIVREPRRRSMKMRTFGEGEGEAACKVDSIIVPLPSTPNIYIHVHHRITL